MEQRRDKRAFYGEMRREGGKARGRIVRAMKGEEVERYGA